jgi:CubicO group peptidase (beta-lactamase class C family)
MRRTLESRMRDLHVPGVSVAVIFDHRVAWVKGYGVANAVTREPVTETTMFSAGSISKALNAMAALKLVERGDLSLDVPINDTLRSWKIPENEFTRKQAVTLRHLLSHTAGTTVHGFGEEYAPGELLPTVPEMLEAKPPANNPAVYVDFTPGDRSRYSGGGAMIAQLAIMDRVGRPYDTILRELVFAPLGMEHTTFEQPLPRALASLAARPHDAHGEIMGPFVYPQSAAGGLWATPGDLARFFSEIDLGVEGRSTVVSKTVAASMTTIVQPREGETVSGMGTFDNIAKEYLRLDGDVRYFGHEGANQGFQAIALVRLEKGYGAVMMANSEHGFELFGELGRAIAAEYGWEGQLPPIEEVPADDTTLDALEGRYANPLLATVTVKRNGRRLLLHQVGATEMSELVSVGSGTFVGLDSGNNFRLDPTTRGLAVSRGSRSATLRRLAPEETTPFLQLEAGRLDRAATEFKRVYATNPDHPLLGQEMLNDLGMELLLHQGNVPAAVTVLRVNTELHPNSAAAFDSLGRACMRAGDKAGAVKAYTASLSALRQDETTFPSVREQYRVNAEKQLRLLRGQ